MKNEEFVRDYSQVVKDFNAGEYQNKAVKKEIDHVNIEYLSISVYTEDKYSSIQLKLRKPLVGVMVAKDLLEFWILDSQGVKQFFAYAKVGNIKQMNPYDFIITSPKGNITSIGLLPRP